MSKKSTRFKGLFFIMFKLKKKLSQDKYLLIIRKSLLNKYTIFWERFVIFNLISILLKFFDLKNF